MAHRVLTTEDELVGLPPGTYTVAADSPLWHKIYSDQLKHIQKMLADGVALAPLGGHGDLVTPHRAYRSYTGPVPAVVGAQEAVETLVGFVKYLKDEESIQGTIDDDETLAEYAAEYLETKD